jgi:hypothetical protein
MRNFGITLLVAFSLIGLVMSLLTLKRTGVMRVFPLGICGSIGLLVFASSFLLENSVGLWIYKAWMGIAVVLGEIVGPVVVGTFYFLVLTPIGLVLRLVGHDPLQHKKGSGTTFWHPLRHSTTPKSYERQF